MHRRNVRFGLVRFGFLGLLAAGFVAVSALSSEASTITFDFTSGGPNNSAQAQGTDFSKVRWRAYDSLAQGFSMPLPEDLAWRIEDRADTWLVAKHAPTSTTIAARIFTLDALANRAR